MRRMIFKKRIGAHKVIVRRVIRSIVISPRRIVPRRIYPVPTPVDIDEIPRMPAAVSARSARTCDEDVIHPCQIERKLISPRVAFAHDAAFFDDADYIMRPRLVARLTVAVVSVIDVGDDKVVQTQGFFVIVIVFTRLVNVTRHGFGYTFFFSISV